MFTKHGEVEHDTFACTSIGFTLCKERKSLQSLSIATKLLDGANYTFVKIWQANLAKEKATVHFIVHNPLTLQLLLHLLDAFL